MKKLLLSLSAIFAFGFTTYSQDSFLLEDIDAVVSGTANQSMESYVTLINTQAYQITVGAKRKVISAVAGSTNFFCWDVCYLAQVDSSSGELTIGAHDTLYNFYGHYNGEGNQGICVIEYCFFDIDFPADSACYRANYYGGVTGIETLESAKEGAVLYPNPTQGQATLKYKSLPNESYSFALVNMMGQAVKTTELQSGFDGEIPMDLSSVASGIYTYQLCRNGQSVTSGKIALKN
ncbi:MAG: T9SS type A sorting domain-containing protein [Bacteroidia bacterium]|nr:T9SS type A sorting domain-containing protein [Bacteroidia bacterium]